jgi:hypothetical protein
VFTDFIPTQVGSHRGLQSSAWAHPIVLSSIPNTTSSASWLMAMAAMRSAWGPNVRMHCPSAMSQNLHSSQQQPHVIQFVHATPTISVCTSHGQSWPRARSPSHPCWHPPDCLVIGARHHRRAVGAQRDAVDGQLAVLLERAPALPGGDVPEPTGQTGRADTTQGSMPISGQSSRLSHGVPSCLMVHAQSESAGWDAAAAAAEHLIVPSSDDDRRVEPSASS